MTSLHSYTRLVVIASFLLLIAGAIVTSTGSGTAIGEWPSISGRVTGEGPPGAPVYERTHRLAGMIVGLMTIGLALWIRARDNRRAVNALALTAAGAVVLQGILGGMAVRWALPMTVSTAHAALAHAFFGCVVVLALVTSQGWLRAYGGRDSFGSRSDREAEKERLNLVGSDTRVRTLATWTAVFAYLQVLLGAAMRQTGAGLAIPDYPLAFGQVLPPAEMLASGTVALSFLHRVTAVVTAVLVAFTFARIWTKHSSSPELVRPAWVLLGTILLQVALGGIVTLTGPNVFVNTAHVAGGALAFAAALVVALMTWRPLLSNGSAWAGARNGAPSPAPVPRASSASYRLAEAKDES